MPLKATVFRPARNSAAPSLRRPLVVINHGTDAKSRHVAGLPVFHALSRWFVERGFVVLLPQRRGHGSTGGAFVEGLDPCGDADHYGSGLAAAADIEASIRFMAEQAFVDGTFIVVAGTSSGGWASLALASRNVAGVRLIVNFAGGRGGHAYGRRNVVCQPERLIAAAGRYARRAPVPTVWYYARNDSYFGPGLATSMAHAWETQGGSVALRMLPDVGADGHFIATDPQSWKHWVHDLDGQLASLRVDDGVRSASSSVTIPATTLLHSADRAPSAERIGGSPLPARRGRID